jgi:hypothetical protein
MRFVSIEAKAYQKPRSQARAAPGLGHLDPVPAGDRDCLLRPGLRAAAPALPGFIFHEQDAHVFDHHIQMLCHRGFMNR